MLSPREVARPALKLEQTQLFVQVGRRVTNGVNPPTPVFAVQPLAEPMGRDCPLPGMLGSPLQGRSSFPSLAASG